MKKVWKSLLLTLIAVLLFGAAICSAKPVSAAKKCNLTRGHFNLYYGGSDGVIVKLKLPYDNITAEVAFYLGGKKIYSGRSDTYVTYRFKPKTNQIYTYRIRALYKNKPIGNWSKCRAFSTIVYNASLPNKRQNIVRFTMPKNKYVKNSSLYMSTSSDKGFKKVGTVLPGKSITVSRFNGSALADYKTYYYEARVALKSGNPCATIFTSSFYIYSRSKAKGLGTPAYGIDQAMISALVA